MPLRQRKEVQEMPRHLVLIALFGIAVQAADEPIWKEIGLESTAPANQPDYRLTAWKFRDATSALAGLGELVSASKDRVERVGNYVVVCQGNCPKDLAPLAAGHRDGSVAAFYSYLPVRSLVPRSERYVVGPVGLNRNLPQIPESTAAFQFGTEAAAARYRTSKGERTLAIFSFLTPQMARQQFPDFRKIPGSVVKRSGPMIAIVLDSDEKSAAPLLKDIEYQASLSWDQQPPLVILPQTAAQIVLAGLKLAGVVIGFCLLSGLAYGAFRLLRRAFGYTSADDSMILLGLMDK